LEIAAQGKELFKHASPNEKRELIGLLGLNLLLDDKMVQITLYKPFSTLASCLDSSIWLPLHHSILNLSFEYKVDSNYLLDLAARLGLPTTKTPTSLFWQLI